MSSNLKNQIYERIVMNRQSGRTYTLKIKDIPSPLVGIPVPSNRDPNKFLMDVTNADPKTKNRIIEADIADIECMEEN
ncbi:MAG: hypothetical protein RBR67_06005 [Desulfobacterium sp.]|jgi:hypothetical protein|nr:hypothetical protein [Desulfobacterium sp.]